MKVGCIALVQILPFSYSLFFLHPRVVMEAIWAIKWTSVKSQLQFVVVFYINPFFCTIFHKRLLPAENMDGWLSTLKVKTCSVCILNSKGRGCFIKNV